ncbi:MAG: asparagine synthase B [Acidobacteriota bacterium]
MCSILGILDIRKDPESLRRLALELSLRQRHRGPDWSGIYADDRAVLAHERLAIVDPLGGAQPLLSPDGRYVLAVNGEIYNHQELRRDLPHHEFQTASDCEPILALHAASPADPVRWLETLNGIFAFVLHDRESGRWLAARDPVGVVPLYTGQDADGQRFFASEMKALTGVCHHIEQFPPGSFQTREMAAPTRYYAPSWREFTAVEGRPYEAASLRSALDAAVERQMMCDVPYGVLLSGGLDSSLIAALAARHARHRIETGGREEAWWPQLHSFAIGLAGSPDLEAAQLAADAIETVHHPFTFTLQEGLDALRSVIYHLETFDVTTVRASTPMFLLARRIKAMGIKMVLSGEGADEIFGGYLYFHKAPDARAFHEETVRKLDALHMFDCLRANKAMAAWGVEARVPYLDRKFLDMAMAFDPIEKMVRTGRMEKHLLRAAFDGVLPESILWRQKEQFSDGVGYGWIDGLRDHAARVVDERDLAAAAERFNHAPPTTAEGYLYRSTFEELFPGPAPAATVPGGKSIACSTPAALEWDASFAAAADPSGRAVDGVHKASYGGPKAS